KYKWFFVGGLICLIVAIIIHLALKVKTTFIYKAINKLKFELNQNDKSEEKMIKQLHKKIKEIVYYSNVYIAVPFVFLVIGIIFLCTFTVLNM
ncbi:MAG: hypothetical protein QM535_22500, partial [Limnohabitans sp.]|nr:hypothetical protein [Limnohabitans sp.]